LPTVSRLEVSLNDRRVGTLAQTPNGVCAFEYDAGWLAKGFSISPLSLPLNPGVFVARTEPFDGLFGVFNDSLPDGWGALLLDRKLRSLGYDPASIGPLARLAVVGGGGRGALRYEPSWELETEPSQDNLDELARACLAIFDEKPSADLDSVFAAGGSSGGARPKAYIAAEGSSWLVKFPSRLDPQRIGPIEYAYAQAAGSCGIAMPRTRLFPSSICEGFFGTERFDRTANGLGVHMVTASGMLEVSHRVPALDYRHLFQVTARITNNMEQTLALYRLMCFNVFAHNQDDHSNNFAWLCEDGVWRLAPGYDLTYSTSFGNEHATTVDGIGNPGLDDVVRLGREFGIPARDARRVASEIAVRCREPLAQLGLPTEEGTEHAIVT
jgi:serine/threonine-protein kinase HipA